MGAFGDSIRASRCRVPYLLALHLSLPQHLQPLPNHATLPPPLLCPRLQLKAASRQATVSTASMGKFDRLARGEKKEDRAAARGKKRKFLPTADKVGGRRQHLCLALTSRLPPHVRREQVS